MVRQHRWGSQEEKLARVAGATVIVGVDVGKDWHYVQMISAATGQAIGPARRIENTRAGFELLDRMLGEGGASEVVGRHVPAREVIVGLEPTGVYWMPLAYHLAQLGVQVVTVSPYATKQAKELADNSPTKSDAKDARVIADLVRSGHFLTARLPEGVYRDLRDLSGIYMQQRRDCNRVVNRLRTELARCFPESLGVFRCLDSQVALRWLEACPLPQDVLALGEEELEKELGRGPKRSRREHKRAKRLMAAAAESIGVLAGAPVRQRLRELAQDLRLAVARLKATQAQMAQTLKQAGPAAQLILSIPGVGPVIAAHILGRLGNPSDYRHPDQMLKMAGLNLTHKSSGHRDGRRHISKRGSAELRSVLYHASISMLAHAPEMRAMYEELHRRLRSGPAALCAMACKLLRMIWGMAQRGIPYDPRKALGRVRAERLLKDAAA